MTSLGGIKIIFESDLTKPEINAILRFIDKLSEKKVTYVEIGTWMGGTFRKVLDFAQKRSLELDATGIDLFEDFKVDKKNNTHISGTMSCKRLEQELIKLGHKNFKLKKGDSVEMIKGLPKLNNSVVFIDGNHTYMGCRRDYLAMMPKINSGYLIFHNAKIFASPDWQYFLRDGGPYKVVQEAKKNPDLKYIGTYDRNAVFKFIGKQ
ncbi:class I SAM-dependent methyltransferase [Candidatus Woesearchaeota archaeon]|nr:class I SAM-dependent methyltransferase [Candidatus Woesearchaeota archaeon]